MNRINSAISNSRPATSPSPFALFSKIVRPSWSFPSGTCNPSGMSDAITFHTAFDASNSRFSHAICGAPKYTVSPLRSFCKL